MSSLVHAALTLRRGARATYGFLAAAAWMALDVAGVFRGALGIEHALVLGALSVVFAARVSARQKTDQRAVRDAIALDLEIGAMLLAAVHTAVQALGGLAGPLYPMVYVVVAFLAAFATKPAGSILGLFAIALEASISWVGDPSLDPRSLALHSLFVLVFGVLNVLFTRAEIARVRERSRKERALETERAQSDLRLFRLVAAPSTEDTVGERSIAEREARLHRSSVEEVRDAVYHVLELLRRSLELHTCVLLFSEPNGRLRIVELATDSDDIAEGPFDAGAGAVGAVASRGATMNLEHIKLGYRGLCYYRGPAIVRAFLGVPVVEHGHLRGALCVDRADDRPFSPREEELVKSAALQVLRAIQNERVFVQLERSKREQAVLFRASQALGGARTEDQVIDAGLHAASQIAQYDFAALTSFDEARRSHTVLRAVGKGAEAVSGLKFRDNASLTAMVVKNKHALPYRGDFDPRQQTLYTAKAKLPTMHSMLVLPLVAGEDALGTIAIAAEADGAFPDSLRPPLQVVANQLAISLSNARAVKRLEEMATTDGLTGCLNKRAFLEELENKLKSAERFKRKLSLLVTDIDHFKSVNDTYGHATGDVVIKGLGEILLRMKRETDRVARFGGEEFCILCEETDTEGATQLAERVREELGGTLFPSELGNVKVTCSIGVATFPQDASTGSALFEITDKALYQAKRTGRNRVCTSTDV